ncbi:type I CRISPR-associated protein Cas8a1/Csx8 [Coprococcus sp. CLA-AA-H212]|jgi:CRISPR-associated protein Cst1|uniref:Type I CRISPR-associated protein Cas8a1/Csx8 n=1 Tax=Coprococcus hominis (ex Arizal et al. 2022) TaxID=2881262 RepID=A0ABS8FKF3_9FIRM|nr:type I CRISPR-associated protein Cas8a1/Csx8 [Coprococcus hominis (ex Arizal et al. 2022)]MCC2217637.1 type I CRISPR-associated protein Cas8a1/Csx8 [Coprococcus hominis (ex Arizal et al. 2022)]
MKTTIEHPLYDTLLLPTEWRYSAAIVGLIRFFDFIEETEGKKLYTYTNNEDKDRYAVYSDICGYIQGILYNSTDLTEERYLLFCENWYDREFQHRNVEALLTHIQKFSQDNINDINSYLNGTSSNTVMKKIFKGIKFDGTNTDTILNLIDEHRLEIIKETFRYKTTMYRNFANTNKLMSDTNPHCRLLSYDLDENRKSKAASYYFDTSTFIASDIYEFDFIPFAFTYTKIGFFVNSNTSIEALVKCNNQLKEKMDVEEQIINNRVIRDGDQTKLIKAMLHSNDFLNCDVEIICKDREQESFDTMLIRKQALQRLKKIYDNYNLRYVHKYNYNYWLNVEEELIRCCLNYTYLDKLLEQLLLLSRIDTESRTIQIIQPLVQINMEWKGVNQTMQDTIERAKKVGYYIGKTIKEKNGENKVKSYKNKLINATVSHDRERVLEIMLQLSGYTDGEISTIYDILDNPDNWSDIAISFTNAMIPYTKKEKEEN